jgi:hypothetical protein
VGIHDYREKLLAFDILVASVEIIKTALEQHREGKHHALILLPTCCFDGFLYIRNLVDSCSSSEHPRTDNLDLGAALEQVEFPIIFIHKQILHGHLLKYRIVPENT